VTGTRLADRSLTCIGTATLERRMEDKVRNAIMEELRRQSAEGTGLEVSTDDDRLVVNGPVDLDALVMVVIGSVAGGP
jgi:hypothetical protein